jgi:hypothetical protein
MKLIPQRPVIEAIWDYGETIHLRVGEIPPCAVRRRERGKIFVRHPVNRQSERSEEERSAPQKAAHEQNAQPENHGRNYKVKDHDLQR